MLGRSIRAWYPAADRLVMLSSAGSEHDIEGWTSCEINRSYYGHVDPRVKAWALVEYEAVVLMEPDTLVVGNLAALFSVHVARMRQEGLKTGAVVRGCPEEQRYVAMRNSYTINYGSSISMGVLLVIPDLIEYMRLKKKSMQASPASLRHVLQELASFTTTGQKQPTQQTKQIYALPPEWNANIAWKACGQGAWWSQASIRILHFTVAKPWASSLSVDLGASWFAPFSGWNAQHPWACWLMGASDACTLWNRARVKWMEGGDTRYLFCWTGYSNRMKEQACAKANLIFG